VRIVIVHSTASAARAWHEAIAARLPEAVVAIWPQELDEPADYAIGWNPPAEFFERETRLKAFFSAGAGVEQIVGHASAPRSLPIIRLEDAGMARQMAEYCAYEVIGWCTSRRLYDEQQRLARWHEPRPRRPAEWPVGVFGLGFMGRQVATTLRALGYRVHAYARSPKPLDGMACYADHGGAGDFTAFLRATRVLIVLAPLTSETRDRFDETVLRQLQPGAYVINAARGGLIVDEALLALLESGHLSGATLDVFRTEPLPPDHPFWRHPKIRVTPHIAALTLAPEGADQVAEKIGRLEAGLPVTGVVERERGY
jgi:glyoxylate/hydroxypyruvate reductase A